MIISSHVILVLFINSAIIVDIRQKRKFRIWPVLEMLAKGVKSVDRFLEGLNQPSRNLLVNESK